MPQSKVRTEQTKKRQAVSTRIRSALEKTARDLQRAPDGLTREAGERPLNVVAAFSGGLDSTVLLFALSKLKGSAFEKITAVHVHHGLSKNADQWASFCEEQAKKLKVDFILRKVQVPSGGDGIEGEARKARYRVLEDVAERVHADAILTAHHLDDQLETFLIQWMRGAGPEGLSGMPPIRREGNVMIARPLLDFQRSELEEFAQKKHLKWVEDESNSDTSYLRNTIRLNIIPELEKARPGFKAAAARSVQIVAESAEILKETAEADLARVTEKGTGFLLLEEFFLFSTARQALLLRAWLNKSSFKTPGRSRLLEIIRQIKETEKQSVCLLIAEGLELRKYGTRLIVRAREKPEEAREFVFTWRGETEIDLPQFNGKLLFYPSEEGFNEGYLKSQPLTVKMRSGGEKIKIHKFRPSKLLKVLYQEAGVPDFERKSLPLVWRGKELIYAAGIGEEIREKLDDDGTPRFSMRFEKNPSLFS